MQQALVQTVQNQAPRHKYEDRRLEITSFAFGIRIYIQFFSTHVGLLFYKWVLSSGYTYMAVWVGGLEVWEIKVMCKIDLKNVFFCVFCICFIFCLTNLI